MKYKLSLILIFAVVTYFSCEKCELIERTVDGPNPMFDCPELNADIGDPCDDGNPDTSNDIVNGNCECIGGGMDFDCPDLMLNIGDACTDNDDTTINDIVTDNCECVGESIFDCPDLGLNIGDPCDDNDPNTVNDMVDANCNCSGEVITDCTGRLLVLRSEIQDDALGPLFLDFANKESIDMVDFDVLEILSGSPIQEGEPFPFQFSTINPTQNQYFFGFQYAPTNLLDPLLTSSTDGSFSPSYQLSELSFAAPVIHQGEMYAIDVVFDDPTVQYSILNIDLSDGQVNTLFTGSVTVNSTVVNPLFFSASNGNDKVFFLAGSSLFEYDVLSNSVNHVLLEPNQDPDMPIIYTGIEYQADSDRLLAIKSQSNGTAIQSDLISISLEGTFTQNELLDIVNYTLFSDAGILHSTAFSQCDNRYYITTLFALEQPTFESYLIEVDIDNSVINDKVFPGFLMGVEVQEF